jgi:hypothetical protein
MRHTTVARFPRVLGKTDLYMVSRWATGGPRALANNTRVYIPHLMEFHECPRHSSASDARSNGVKPHHHLPIFPRYFDSIDSAFVINARNVNVPSS